MRVLVFGTGKLYLKNREKFSEMEIVAFLDNDLKKQGTLLDGKMIDVPDHIAKYEYDFIIIVSVHYKEMREQLVKLGIERRVIIDAENKGDWENLRKVKHYEWEENDVADRKVLLITHDFSLTGAPMVLYYAAKILKKSGYGVFVYSKRDGMLKYDYLNNKISVSIFDDYNFTESAIQKYFSGYQIILANTVTLFHLVRSLEKVNTPVLWWLHEEDNVYAEYGIERIPQYGLLHVYGVSNRAESSYIKYSGSAEIGRLVYGLPNKAYKIQGNEKKSRAKIVFAIVGCVSERKGHDVFISAIKKNWSAWKDRAEFWMIGSISERQKSEMRDLSEVRMFGSIDHEELLKLYSEMDVVVCPSRNDPMPVVLAEGMMNRKVCIASDMTGTAEKIEQYKNGLICRAGDVDSLSDQIEWVLCNTEKLETMGEAAYKVYLKEFSYEQFEKNMLKIMDQIAEV